MSHQLSWIVEALEVPDLGHHRYRDDEPDAAHRLNSVHDRGEAPGWQKIRDLPCQTLDPRLAIGDSINVVLKDDLLRRMHEPHHRRQAPVCTGPTLLVGMDPAMPQQNALQVLTHLARHAHRRNPRPGQIAHHLMRGIRSPDQSQFAGPVQLCQHHSIAAVGLHPVARLHRDQRWRQYDAAATPLDKLAAAAIAAGGQIHSRDAAVPLADSFSPSLRTCSGRCGTISQ